MSDKAYDTAQAKAARLLQKRTGSVLSGQSSSDHQSRNKRRPGYAASVSTVVSYASHPHFDDDFTKPIQYENTYQVEPAKKFPTSCVRDIINEVLHEYIPNDRDYEPELCRQLSKTVSEVIKQRVKEMALPRFKIVCVVNIGQVNNQGLRMGSRCLWNHNYDNFASYSMKNHSMFVVANVYGIYFE